MTRQEWFDAQSAEVQEGFISNCITLNSDDKFFEDWINYKHNRRHNDIQGAFVWNYSPEGHGFWDKLNDIFLEEVGA